METITALDTLEIPGAFKVVFHPDEETSWYAWNGSRYVHLPSQTHQEQEVRDRAAWLLAAKWPMNWAQRPDAPDTFLLCCSCQHPLWYFHYVGLRYVAGIENAPRPCWLCPACGARTYGKPAEERAA